ncbi:serine protease inhibitor, serpin [Culex quinquefasciatus]|uniref:Serine protease inhibitor, serpin n=4 Tax=Culex pipiens complex TaxID=518105 RepID=B0WIA6_CULQU|nr:serine protease inhibitor, serpin [Culex quinquefasciatus]|eukprot:XP_001848440.1 serine protease inhibitor, serpin [Culex quinquefasciatus]
MLIKAVVPLVFVTIAVVVGADGPDFSFGDADFSVEYFKAAFNASRNEVVSPLSIRLALAAFYQVAGSVVEQTIQRAFYLPLEKSVASENAAGFLEEVSTNQQLQVAFKVLKNQDLLSDEFASTLSKVFKTAPESVEFADKRSVVTSVNTWANRATNGQIRNFLKEDELDTNTELILLNAVSLKASWAERFSEAKTDRQSFAFRNGIRPVDMMHETVEVLYKVAPEYHAVQIPYNEESDLSMWILVPRGQGNFDSLVASLSSDLLDDIETTAMPRAVDISLPRFQIRSELPAKKIIEKMGFEQLFAESDFSIFKNRKSELSDLRQSTFLQVNEEGTEAAVVSSATTKFRAKNAQFNANQPFVFIIKKISTDTIVFIGHYSNFEQQQ